MAGDTAPEAASGTRILQSVKARRAMVATANPLASAAARATLERGGSALDAVIAAQWVLGLVEPQSSGLGGGGFLLTWQAAQRKLQAWDGRETAPAAADETLFLQPDGQPMPFAAAVVGGRSVGVPGLVRMLEKAHRAQGQLPWATLFEPAIDLARDGFVVGHRLATLVSRDPALAGERDAARYFFRAAPEPTGSGELRPIAAGERLRNPDYAESLAAIADQGSDALHTGPIARAIVQAVRRHPRNPGRLSEADLAGYQAIEREPLCAPWRRWMVCGPPPPSSGTIAVLQMLGMLESVNRDTLVEPDQHGQPRLTVDGVHWFSEAGRLAFADRDHYIADPAFVPWPAGLLEPGYLSRRAGQIRTDSAPGKADPGHPPGLAGDAARRAGRVLAWPETGTTHLSVVDADGNAAALTSTIESAFGSRQWAAGFLLNNQLTDFSFRPLQRPARPVAGTSDPAAGPRGTGDAAGTAVAIANRVQPGKRPRSSMTPLIIFERDEAAAGQLGRLAMVTGSPGGSAIINYVARIVILTLGDGLDPQTAIALPNVGSRNGPTEVEVGRLPGPLRDALRERGHTLSEIEQTSGIQSIVRRDGHWVGAADPRREGLVLGLDQ